MESDLDIGLGKANVGICVVEWCQIQFHERPTVDPSVYRRGHGRDVRCTMCDGYMNLERRSEMQSLTDSFSSTTRSSATKGLNSTKATTDATSWKSQMRTAACWIDWQSLTKSSASPSSYVDHEA